MRQNLTSVNVIIDSSGSMEHLTNETISGFNTFVADQRNVQGDVVFTLCVFNTRSELVHDAIPLAKVPNLTIETYRPNGYTALLDAVGSTIDRVGRKLAAMPEEERPSKVIFLIITDGEENSSRKYTLEQVKSMVTHQREKYSWEFVFLGANIDAIAAGTSLGVTASNSVGYTASSVGTKALYSNVSRSLGNYRIASNQQVDFFNQPGQDPVDLSATPDADPVDATASVDPVSNNPFLKTTKRLFGKK